MLSDDGVHGQLLHVKGSQRGRRLRDLHAHFLPILSIIVVLKFLKICKLLRKKCLFSHLMNAFNFPWYNVVKECFKFAMNLRWKYCQVFVVFVDVVNFFKICELLLVICIFSNYAKNVFNYFHWKKAGNECVKFLIIFI